MYFVQKIGKNHHTQDDLIVIVLNLKSITLKTIKILKITKGTMMSEAYIIDAIRTPRGKGKKDGHFMKSNRLL